MHCLFVVVARTAVNFYSTAAIAVHITHGCYRRMLPFRKVMVVVTRYSGGIKLGTGGLCRAYGGASRQCLQAAERY